MKGNKAFTLIELLVIIAITILMTVLVFSNYGKNNEIFALERSSQKLAQDLRRTEDMAMSGFEGDSTTLGYGVYFKTADSGLYRIYEEKNTNTNMWYEAAIDTVKETINIEPKVVICSIKDNGASQTQLSVSFEPPNPLTYVGGVSTGHEASIVLCLSSDNTKTKTIKINNTGRIEITTP